MWVCTHSFNEWSLSGTHLSPCGRSLVTFPEVRVFEDSLLLLMLISPYKFFLANAAECDAFRGSTDLASTWDEVLRR